MMKYFMVFLSLIVLFVACSKDKTDSGTSIESDKDVLFHLLDPKETGINFSNDLQYDRQFNIYTYRNFYNGGGVAIGDVNRDGLADIYFSSNMDKNVLYLNKGDWKFEDVTTAAGVGGTKTWSTGVSMVDINADGWLDIYVCNSGDVDGDKKDNELFINNQDGTYTEQAAKYGIADQGYSTHAAFFDYDKDGDLDMYLLNNSYRAINSFNPKINIRDKRDSVGGDKLYKNENGRFVDVSAQAGIYGSEIGFGLGVTVGDIDQDGWDDIYISNDFFEKDYIYMNNHDGTFTEDLENQMLSISVASMGADMADLDNDGYPEIFVTEMLPNNERRIKTKTTFEDWDKYQANIENGYYHQFTRNMLHSNNGDKTFNEVGRYAGIEASDWSWGALLADFDNDGLRDIFIANGINKDLTDQDFINYLSNEETMKKMTANNTVDYKELIDVIPSERIPNRMFFNKGNLRFEDVAENVGVAQASHSNGSAYGDLDNDGDLDLVVNNVGMPAFVYQNNSSGNFVQLVFTDYEGKNSKAIGTKVYVHAGVQQYYGQFMPTKGFQSSMDYKMHFGIGNNTAIDSIVVVWPNKRRAKFSDIPINQLSILSYKQGESTHLVKTKPAKQILKDVSIQMPIEFKHQENAFVDFDRDRLLFHMITSEGPHAAVGDFNGDGKHDLAICGAKGQASAILIQTNSNFKATNKTLLAETKENEDQDVVAFDADNDGDIDLYFCSGGNEFNNQSSAIRDRLYINDGKGNFSLSAARVLPTGYVQSGSVDVADIDKDGDMDLAVAERVKSFQHGVPCNAYVVTSTKGAFDFDADNNQGLKNQGMHTDIKFADLDSNGELELVSCGKYMPISVYSLSADGNWQNVTKSYGLEETQGWWNALSIVDIDKDGDMDIIAANHGTNSRFHASKADPLCLHINDFDKNGSIEHILCNSPGQGSFPFALRHDIIKQLPHLKKRFLNYADYAEKGIEAIFSEDERQNMLTLEVKEMETCIYLNEGGKFLKQALPYQAQLSPIYAINADDFDNDGIIDLVMGGNLYEAKPEIGRYDASRGCYLKGKQDGSFEYLDPKESGFIVHGQVRDIQPIVVKNKKHLLVTRNNDTPLLFAVSK